MSTEDEDATAQTSILLTMMFTMLIILIAYLYQNFNVMQNVSRFLPNASCNILMGMLVGFFISLQDGIEESFSFNQEFFFLFMLPPIIFASGFNLRKQYFFYNFGTILLYAFIGTALTTTITALILDWLSKYTYELNSNECLIFASLISAIDPVATIVTMQAAGVGGRLYALIFGEAVLNDAVAIVINNVFLEVAANNKNIVSELIIAVPKIIFISVFSVLIGVSIALGSSWMYKNTKLKENHVLEVTLFFILGLLPYMICENAHGWLSGIMAILFSGVFFDYYTWYHLSPEGQTSVKVIVHMLEFVSEGFIFFFLGSAVWRSENNWHFGLFGLTTFACIVGRGLAIYLLSWFANVFWRKHSVTSKECTMMWFSGLRGPVSFALAFRISDEAVPDEDDRHVIITTTLLIIYVTSFLMGGCSSTVLSWLNLIPNEDEKPQQLGLDTAHAQVMTTRTKTLAESKHWFTKLNMNFLEDTFGTKSREFRLRHWITAVPRDSGLPVHKMVRSVSVIAGGPRHFGSRSQKSHRSHLSHRYETDQDYQGTQRAGTDRISELHNIYGIAEEHFSPRTEHLPPRTEHLSPRTGHLSPKTADRSKTISFIK